MLPNAVLPHSLGQLKKTERCPNMYNILYTCVLNSLTRLHDVACIHVRFFLVPIERTKPNSRQVSMAFQIFFIRISAFQAVASVSRSKAFLAPWKNKKNKKTTQNISRCSRPSGFVRWHWHPKGRRPYRCPLWPNGSTKPSNLGCHRTSENTVVVQTGKTGVRSKEITWFSLKMGDSWQWMED